MNIALTILRPDAHLLHDGHQVFLMQFIAAVSGSNPPSDAGIFVYRRNPSFSNTGDQCVAVANVKQMLEMPLNAPGPSGIYYRRNTGIFLCQSADEVSTLRTSVLTQANNLTADWNALQSLPATEVVTVTGDTATGIPIVPATNDVDSVVRMAFSADRSSVECYDAQGNLVAVIPLALP